MEEKIYLALLHSLGITQKKLQLIFGGNQLGKICGYKEFYEKLSHDLLQSYDIKSKEIENILKRKKIVTLEFIKNKIEERNVEIITVKEPDYPEELLHISQVPYILYVRGKVPEGPKIAVVGSRKISSYGKKAIENIIPEVSTYFPIVSGGAFGCDTQAHLKSLESGNKTISIIGTSISEDYPTGNKKMYDDIVRNGGAIVSIFPIGVPGSAYNFPIRNEIVAGLSVGVLVVEAMKKSGSLITSKLALDLGRDLFAIPGEIFKSNSVGCNDLIKNGEAKLVSCSLDILEEYNIGKLRSNSEEKVLDFGDETEEKIYNSLLTDSFTIDELVKKIGLDITTLSFKLSMLEIKGIIKKTLGGKFEVK